MIERIRSQMQERLDQIVAEADKLRRALSALDPREPSPAPKPPSRPAASRARPTRAAAPAKSNGAGRPRTAPGATKRAVLAALDSRKAMTAGEVAAATGLARPTVSTTLSKLATSGEISKAERGYRLAANGTNAGAGTVAAK